MTGAWTITHRGPETAATATTFTVANGYLGLRGTWQDAPGAVLNGFHETWPIVYPEDAYGLARTGQTIVPAPDGAQLRVTVAGAPPRSLRVERTLDLRRGLVRHREELEAAGGERLIVGSTRLASLADRHLAAIAFEVRALDRPVELELASELATPAARGASSDPRVGGGATGALVPLAADGHDGRAVLVLRTERSGLTVAAAMDHVVEGAARAETVVEPGRAAFTLRTRLEPGATLRVVKLLAYHWAPGGADVAGRARATLDDALGRGHARIRRDHTRAVQAFWDRSDVEVDAPGDVQRAVRFNLFQLLQATARAEGLGVPAKGVTGFGYEGHHFWDTEVYVVPFLAHTSPRWARSVLENRCRQLPEARRRAAELGHRGALFPWRTVNGEEASAWYAAGTAQYHINADIAYAMHQYNRVTGDLAFLLDEGAEVLVETARIWLELGFFSERHGGAFCINAVTGPDEYTTVVDNNAYTNLLARENLEIAVRVVEWLRAMDRGAYAALAAATGLDEAEVAAWRTAAERMFIPRDEELGIVLQDERFLHRKRWDFSRPRRGPLLLHHHPLELYRHQVVKQADVVLAAYLAGHTMSVEEKRRTFDYYDPITTGDSSLSASIQSVMASEVGRPEAALRYFLEGCSGDLEDRHGNTGDGIHVAACGGTWLALVAGFGGLRDADGTVCLSPRLPAAWRRLRFRLRVRGQLLEVDMESHATTYRLLEGTGLPIRHFDDELRLQPGAEVAVAAGEDGTALAA
jgi:alpha,alpha-trehalose phosphorylase